MDGFKFKKMRATAIDKFEKFRLNFSKLSSCYYKSDKKHKGIQHAVIAFKRQYIF